MSTDTILLSKTDEIYLQKCAQESGFTYGIIVGQFVGPDKYIVAHLAKNGEEDVDVPDSANGPNANLVGPKKVEDIDVQSLTNQWVSASKMIPGSFEVLGTFVVGTDKDLTDETTFKGARKLLSEVDSILKQDNNAFQLHDETTHSSYLFLCYSTAVKKVVCKSYTTSNGGAFTNMDCRFVEKPLEWYLLETNYELDDTFVITEATPKVNVEEQFRKAFQEVKKSLTKAEIFLQNEFVIDDLLLDAYVKKKRSVGRGGVKSAAVGVGPATEPIKASILLRLTRPTKLTEGELNVRRLNGSVRCCGYVTSRVWCNPKNTVGAVKSHIRTDVLRTLATRLQMYCDGLTEPHITGDGMFISEPPRRIYFAVTSTPTATGVRPIQFSEYIFRGESPTVAVAQAKQVLDLDINSDQIEDDPERPADVDPFAHSPSDTDEESQRQSESGGVSLTTSDSTRDLVRTLTVSSVAVALLILLASVVLHYFMRH